MTQTTLTMAPEEMKAWADRYKGSCQDCNGPCERTAVRCWKCESNRRKRASNARTKGDGRMNTRNAMTIGGDRNYVETPVAEPQGHVHHWKLPSTGDGSGVLVGVCECGESKEHRPWGHEIKWGGGRS